MTDASVPNPYLARLARHQGREYLGGPTCWDPGTACERACWVCPHNVSPDWRPTRNCTTCGQLFKAASLTQTTHITCEAS